MKRYILLVSAICLTLTAHAQKKPKKAFSTEQPPLAGIEWQAGDEISMPDGDAPQGVVYTATDAGVRTSFIGKGAGRSEEGHWLALYPASALREWNADTLRFIIPREQTADGASKPAYSRTDGRDLDFKPLTAYLKFELPSGFPPVKEIRLSTNKYISGSFKTNLGAKKISVILDMGERYRDIVLKPGKDGVIAPGEYNMAIFARHLPDGLLVKVEAEDGKVAKRIIRSTLKLSLGNTRDLGILHNLRFLDKDAPVPSEEEVISCLPEGDYPKTEIGRILESGRIPWIVDVLRDTTFKVTEGLDYYQLTAATENGGKQLIYLLRVDQSKGLEMKVTISDESTSSVWKRQIPAKMAANLSTPAKPVYSIINADFCDNREPIKPRGPIHSGGTVWAPSYSLDPRFPQQALSYVGVTFDGKMTIAPSVNYASAKKTLKECTGAGVILLLNSEIQGGYVNTPGRDPRTAIGYTSDNIVWMLAVDGRHGTPGMTYAELASIFKGLGCVDAVNLDGGGSTQMLVRNPATGTLDLCNWPSDPHNGFGGRERPRLNAWAVVKK